MSNRDRFLEGALAATAFAFVALALMYPVLPAPGSRVYGFPSDPLAEVWRLEQFDRGEISLVGDDRSHQANTPDGVDLRRPADVSQVAYDAPAALLARVLGPVPAYSVLVFLALWSAGLAAYGAGRSLGLRWAGSGLAGTIFTLAPVHLVEAQLHVPHALVFMLPLLLVLGIRSLEGPSWRRGALFGGGVTVTGYVTGYLFLEAVVLAAGVAGAALVRAVLDPAARSPLARAAASAVLTGLAVGSPLLLVLAIYRGELSPGLERPVSDVGTFSLRLRDYLDPSSATYFGLVGLALAAAGLVAGRTSSTRRWVLGLVALSGFLVSLRPELALLGLDVRMPSSYIHSLVPYWRVFGRIAIVVALAGAFLAAFFVDRLASSRRTSLRFCALAFSVLAVADIIERPPPPAADLGRPDRLADALRQAPGGVAEYPLFGFENYELGPYLFRQMRHDRPLVNGSIESTVSADISAAAASPTYPEAREALSLAGVRSAAFHPGAPRPSDPGFLLQARFPDGTSLYAIAAVRHPVIASVRNGYTVERGPDGTPFQWLRPEAELQAIREDPGLVTVYFDAVSPEIPRLVHFGSAVRRVQPMPTPSRLCLRTDSDGTKTVQISMNPGPRRLPGGDTRITGIGIFHLRAERGCG